jgi:hypothetical protein
MKKVIFTFLTMTAVLAGVNAQYCGGSGPTVCNPSGTLTEPGLSPSSDSLAPVVNGIANNTTIQFKNFNQFTLSGQTVTVQSLRIDSIGNIPAGLCWQTNKTNNTFANQEDGCIQVSGLPCANPGQYKLFILVTANIGVPIQTDADAAGLKYFVRAINDNDAVIPVDTNAVGAFNKLPGYSANAVCASGINDTENGVASLQIVPNPISSVATVTFYAEKSGTMTERITNMIGSEILNRSMDVRAGENRSEIIKGDLPSGVYFYTVTNGKTTSTKRFSIN